MLSTLFCRLLTYTLSYSAGCSVLEVSGVRHLMLSAAAADCRLTIAAGIVPSRDILQCPIPNVRLVGLSGLPILVGESPFGDFTVWNHETGQILAFLDSRDSELTLEIITILTNILVLDGGYLEHSAVSAFSDHTNCPLQSSLPL